MASSGVRPDEITELNLIYLVLAQRLIREDYATGMFKLGVSRELASKIEGLSLSQISKLAASGGVMCQFRFQDLPDVTSLDGDGHTGSLQTAHAAILLAGQASSRNQKATSQRRPQSVVANSVGNVVQLAT